MGLKQHQKDKINELLNEYVLDLDTIEINENDNLKDTLGLDSLDKVELTIELEKKFDITIDDVEFNGVETVSQCYEYVAKKLNTNG